MTLFVGDLDGDQYFISWNEAIIPETVDPANPREVSRPGTPLEPKIKYNSQVDKKIKDHMGNLKRYVSRRVLSFDIGATAKAWEEAANALQLGSRDPYCLALSARYECCLDTNKTGEEIPPIPSNTLKGPLRTGRCHGLCRSMQISGRLLSLNWATRSVPFRAIGPDHPSRDTRLVQPVDVRQGGPHV